MQLSVLPQLQLCNEKLDALELEAIDFQMADEAHLSQETEVDAFWASLQTLQQFPHLGKSTPVPTSK